MYTLGIHGSPTLVSEDSAALGWPFDIHHDASAVLLRDGDVVAAVAQERVDRIKYSNAFPIEAVRFCLQYAGIGLSDVSGIAYPSDESVLDDLIRSNRRDVVRDKNLPLSVDGWTSRTVIRSLLQAAFDTEVPPEKIVFVRHHHAHAMSALAHSGFNDALMYVRDGWGDELSGMVARATPHAVEVLHESPMSHSLGHFYLTGTQLLGYHIGEEYKVMGLSPYGDPMRYRSLIDRHTTHANVGTAFDLPEIWRAFVEAIGGIRARGAALEQHHKDVAATFQRALEDIALRELRHWQEKTGAKNLCFAGGVAQNCSLNGRILSTGMFEQVFVPAAPGDGGLALGAAISVHREQCRSAATRPRPRLAGVAWGTDISEPHAIAASLDLWRDVLTFSREPDIVSRAAHALAHGSVLAWARGRSEFGPRALGCRSILADPRPAENRERINAIVKKRESFRPFAPSVIDEAISQYFDVDAHSGELAFMTFVVTVRDEYRNVLGAVTHTNGTARVQSVSRQANPDYWALLAAFGQLTTVPVLLNTSLNNNAEPIVETIDDAIACFLTTDLDSMALGDFWVEKKASGPSLCRHLTATLAPDCGLEHDRDASGRRRWIVRSRRRRSRRAEIDARTFEVLLHGASAPEQTAEQVQCMYDLWCQRLVRVSPARPAAPAASRTAN